ncbi:hypothetical protein LSCM1_01775 [Leishmania martiniquensis]|uniref:Protein kinase domain-containing protein n=1 Tax=Leishmania martiniquensis TaxID=1580590 RepID=A0A836H453_9TRYP|nr:hypothetical protein LSCM1_01775 [Leishmania martiniquensis]
MSTGDFIVGVDHGNGEDYLIRHGYWVHSPLSQDCTINTNPSSGCGTECNGSAGVRVTGDVGGCMASPHGCLDAETPLPPFYKPLVEDDDDGSGEDSGDSVAKAALGHFLEGCGSGLINFSPLEWNSAEHEDGLYSSFASSQTTSDRSGGTFPCIDEELLGDLGDVIGYGGDRGSFVCRVPPPPLTPTWKEAPSFTRTSAFLAASRRSKEARKAYKKYPTRISQVELSFVSTVYRCARNSEHCQSRSSPFLTPEEAHYAALHLVLPDAVVLARGEQVGLLMPLYNCSLKEFLQSLVHPAGCARGAAGMPPPLDVSHKSTLYGGDNGDDTEACGAHRSTFRFHAAYQPVDSIPVVTAIVFQMLEAVAFLNYRLPHGDGSTGYTHNDLHLDNILLSYEGDVALCDFELVASTPTPSCAIDIRRLPPSSRQSPHGLFSETADTWAFGLMVVSLLTGVDPLFTSNIVNDFSDGPLLLRWDRSPCVLDWEANIKAHVEVLLRRQDSTGKRLEEAHHLLQLCSKCLVNREGAEPLRAVSLLEEPMFLPYRLDFSLATRTVKEWIRNARLL